MSAFQPVTTLAELDALDDDEIVAGYREYRPDDPEPGLNRGLAYWVGWMNRAYDRGAVPAAGVTMAVTRGYVSRGALH